MTDDGLDRLRFPAAEGDEDTKGEDVHGIVELFAGVSFLGEVTHVTDREAMT